MLLRRRFLGLPAAVSGSLRRSHTSAGTRIPWAMMRHNACPVEAPSPQVRLVEPPRISEVYVPDHLVKTAPLPDPDSDVVEARGGVVCAASGDGLLLLVFAQMRLTARIVARQGDLPLRLPPDDFDPDHVPNVTRFVFNPVTNQISRLPPRVAKLDRNAGPLFDVHMGLVTQADRGHGPPDRFAVAELPEGNLMLRFLSETGKWETVTVSRCQLPSARRMEIHHEVLAFRGRLWWVDQTWGAISVDPFSDRPELSFVELPRGSVLPPGAPTRERVSMHFLGYAPSDDDEDGDKVLWSRYRRVGVSEGRLRYVEVSTKEPYLLSSFALDDDVSGWTLEHRVALSKLWADGGYSWLPLKEGMTPRIALLDPLNASVVYLKVDKHIVVVDMNIKEVTGSYLYKTNFDCIPCVLPPWLGSSRIPSAGKKDAEKTKTLANVLVRSDTP
ncbi:uncharacterized protein LOC124648689 [Lolium rigidum]|uniref:uncharacterized protein LOC124648689 n=1 Tax=Lolium rigidum TaxID=89674 RepID=UPI001F5DEB53|nr:uncharacterized protein LOC124648689 [Lolium rigidum]